MKNTLAGRDLISINDLSKEEMELIFSTAARLQKQPKPDLLKGSLLASCFFEASTRTRLSFEAALHRLGGSVIGFAEGGITSVKKGEALFDSMKIISSYVDLVIIRHPQDGSARLAADASDKPVINAGDGANQHPTQTLLDLYTIGQCQGKIEDLHIALVGDLRFGRTVHSLALALTHYPVRLYFVCPENLQLPETIIRELKKKGLKFSFHASIEEVIPKVDILYMSRVQKERFADANLEINPCYHLKRSHLEKAKKTMRILHALPRIDEIEQSIDETAFASYFEQAANGVLIRMALLALILGKI